MHYKKFTAKKVTETRFERITFWRLHWGSIAFHMLESDALPLRHSAPAANLHQKHT